ncbi:hypothetical protein F4781DRAFT_413412 [Annulohypoxylon bovei var. microspora]|nr:hypothetical protein F4781DRAFT_413412 [Annulohypoxylon bovei var. microspora]
MYNADKIRRNRARNPKTRNGCLVCKRRRLKCDEQRPSCRRCIGMGSNAQDTHSPSSGRPNTRRVSVHHHTISTLAVIFLPSLMQKPGNTPVRLCESGTFRPPNSCGVDGSPGDSSLPNVDCETSKIEKTSLLADTTQASPFPTGAGSLDGLLDEFNHIKHDTLFKPCPTDDGTSLICCIPADISSVLLSHYFSAVCQINSVFDLPHNPFRSEVSRMIIGSPLL